MTRRRRPRVIITAGSATFLVACLLVACLVIRFSLPPAYTVYTVQHGLAAQPARWLGQTIIVRATAVGCRSGCIPLPHGTPPLGLVDSPTTDWVRDLGHALPLLVPLSFFPTAPPSEGGTLGLSSTVLPDGAALYTVRLDRRSPCPFDTLASPCVVARLQKKGQDLGLVSFLVRSPSSQQPSR